jgi:hypothetical protein
MRNVYFQCKDSQATKYDLISVDELAQQILRRACPYVRVFRYDDPDREETAFTGSGRMYVCSGSGSIRKHAPKIAVRGRKHPMGDCYKNAKRWMRFH